MTLRVAPLTGSALQAALGDLAALVEYGRARGVRVIFEFDSPGHAGSVCGTHPELCPAPDCREPLTPASPRTLPQSVMAREKPSTPEGPCGRRPIMFRWIALACAPWSKPIQEVTSPPQSPPWAR